MYGFDIDPAPETFLSNPKFKGHQGDIAEAATPKAVVDGALAAFGRVDILCNIAGISDTFNGLDTLEEQAWHRQLAVNLTGPTWLCKAAVDVFRKQGGGGAIVNVSSKAGTSGAVCGVAYTAAKHGLVSEDPTAQPNFIGAVFDESDTCIGGRIEKYCLALP